MVESGKDQYWNTFAASLETGREEKQSKSDGGQVGTTLQLGDVRLGLAILLVPSALAVLCLYPVMY